MSASSRIAFAVGISWLSKAAMILANLFLLPILFRLMGKEELGLWMLLSNSHAFLGLLGLGLAPTLTRHIAMAKGKSGADPGVTLTGESKQHIADLVETGRILLRCLSVAVFLIAWISGYGLINQLDIQEVSPQVVFLSWTLICLGYSLGVWVSYLNCWLTGIGYVGWEQLVGTGILLLTIVFNIVVVLMGQGLLALSVISTISVIAQRFVFLSFIRWRKPELLNLKGRWSCAYARKMAKPSLYAWLTTLGAFLILRTDTYFIALLQGTENIPVYQAGYQLVSNLWQLAVVFGAVSSTFISQAWQAGDLPAIHTLVIRNAKVGLSIMAVGVSFLLVCADEVTTLWLGEGNFVGYRILFVFCTLLTLQTQRGILVTSSRATEDESYAYMNLLAGLLNVFFTWLLIGPLGLLGVSLGTLAAQLMTNSWYGVYRPIKRLKIDFRLYLKQVIGTWLLIFTVCLCFLLVLKAYLLSIEAPDFVIVISSAVLSAAMFLGFSWQFSIGDSQRKMILSKVARAGR